jgi:hypothetical protein
MTLGFNFVQVGSASFTRLLARRSALSGTLRDGTNYKFGMLTHSNAVAAVRQCPRSSRKDIAWQIGRAQDTKRR